MSQSGGVPSPTPPFLTPEPRKNWRRLFGCLGILAVLGAGAAWLWVRSMATLRWGCSETVIWAAERACLQCGLTDRQQEQILEPVRIFAGGVKDGEFSMPTGLSLIRRFDSGPLFATLFCTGLADRLLERDGAEKAGEATSTRIVATFLEVYKTNPPASATLDSLKGLVMADRELTFRRPSGMVVREQIPVMKTGLTAEERDGALTMMMIAIAAARNRPDGPPPPLDLGACFTAALEEIQKEGR